MRINSSSDDEEKKKKKKRKDFDFEGMIFSIVEKSMRSALDQALNDIMASWN